jgi:hypothetical protein
LSRMLAMKDTSMAGCTNSSYQMIDACGALQTFAVNSPHVPGLCRGRRSDVRRLPEGVREIPGCCGMQGVWRFLQGLRRRMSQGGSVGHLIVIVRERSGSGPPTRRAQSLDRARLTADASRHPLRRPMGSAGAGLRLRQSMPSHGTVRTWHVWCWPRRSGVH